MQVVSVRGAVIDRPSWHCVSAEQQLEQALLLRRPVLGVCGASGQGFELVAILSPVDHLLALGFHPEFGACELQRLIRSELEPQLAHAILADEGREGDRVLAKRKRGQQKGVWSRNPGQSRMRLRTSGRPRSAHGSSVDAQHRRAGQSARSRRQRPIS
ncbi:hypothetical protein ACRAWG_36620 [Methylobacterium sp. P31]